MAASIRLDMATALLAGSMAWALAACAVPTEPVAVQVAADATAVTDGAVVGDAAQNAIAGSQTFLTDLSKHLSWKDYPCKQGVGHLGETHLITTISLDVRKEIPTACWALPGKQPSPLLGRLWPTEDGFFAFHGLATGGGTTSYGVLGFYRANGWPVARRVGSCPKKDPCCYPGNYASDIATLDLTELMLSHYGAGAMNWTDAAPLAGNRLLHCGGSPYNPAWNRCNVLDTSLAKVASFELPVGPARALVMLPGEHFALLTGAPQTVAGGQPIARFDLSGKQLSEATMGAMSGLPGDAPAADYTWAFESGASLTTVSSAQLFDGAGGLFGRVGVSAAAPDTFSASLAGVGRVDPSSGAAQAAFVPRTPRLVSWHSALRSLAEPGGVLLAAGPPGPAPWLSSAGTLAHIDTTLQMRGTFVSLAPGPVDVPLHQITAAPEYPATGPLLSYPSAMQMVAATPEVLLHLASEIPVVVASASWLDHTLVAVYCTRSTSIPLGI